MKLVPTIFVAIALGTALAAPVVQQRNELGPRETNALLFPRMFKGCCSNEDAIDPGKKEGKPKVEEPKETQVEKLRKDPGPYRSDEEWKAGSSGTVTPGVRDSFGKDK